MVAVSDFSGLASSIWALASAPAIAPMVSLELCTTSLHLHEVETPRTRFGTFGPDAMPDGLLGVLRHQLLQFDLRGFMIEECSSGLAKDTREFCPGIGCNDVHDPDRLDPWPWRLHPELIRRLAAFHAAPELLLRGKQKMLV